MNPSLHLTRTTRERSDQVVMTVLCMGGAEGLAGCSQSSFGGFAASSTDRLGPH